MSWLIEEMPNQKDLAQAFRAGLRSGPMMVLPGVYDGLSALLARRVGFEGGHYLSGAAFSASQGLPDLGLLESREVSQRAREIVRAAKTPLLVDIDTGYGGVLNVARAVSEMVEAGVAAVQIEDQQMPKKCGHLSGKRLIPTDEMCQKLEAITRIAPDLVIIARTDARAVEGLDSAMGRARRYYEAGADCIFVEALENQAEFMAVAHALSMPLLANMTEFGRSPLVSTDQLEKWGYRAVIFPVSALRVAALAMESLYRALKHEGSQKAWLDRMQTRADLYELLGYERYEALDLSIAKSILPQTPER